MGSIDDGEHGMDARPGSPRPAEKKASIQSLKMEQLGIFSTAAEVERFGVLHSARGRTKSFFNPQTYQEFEDNEADEDIKSPYQRNLNLFAQANWTGEDGGGLTRAKSLYDATSDATSFQSMERSRSYHRSARLTATADPKHPQVSRSSNVNRLAETIARVNGTEDDVRSSLQSSSDDDDFVPEPMHEDREEVM